MEEVVNLAEGLSSFYERFSQCFRAQTRDTSEYGLKYISGLLRMETDRNLANVGRKTETSGQNLQHFVSNSSWARERVIVAVEEEVKVHPAFQEAILVLDESAEEKAGEHSAGAKRQQNGRQEPFNKTTRNTLQMWGIFCINIVNPLFLNIIHHAKYFIGMVVSVFVATKNPYPQGFMAEN